MLLIQSLKSDCPMKKTVLAFSRVSPEMAERLSQDFNVIVPDPKKGDINAQFAEALPESHGLIGAGRKLGREQLQNAAKLEVVSSISVGYDNYDVGYLSERGILLTNTPDVLTETTADWVSPDHEQRPPRCRTGRPHQGRAVDPQHRSATFRHRCVWQDAGYRRHGQYRRRDCATRSSGLQHADPVQRQQPQD